MYTKRIIIISSMFAMIALLFSCEYEFIQPDIKPVPEVVSFSNNIIPVFNEGCNSAVCHGPGSEPPDLSPENAYQAIISGGYINLEKPEESSLYTSVKSGSMKVYARPGDAEIILAWIQQGAKNN